MTDCKDDCEIDGEPTPSNYPLGFVQTRFWFLAELEGGSPSYHVPLAIALDGPLDRKLLHQALNRVVERHPVLRTVYPCETALPLASVQAPATLFLENLAVTGPDAHPRSDAVQSLTTQFALRPFDLARNWPLRALLLQFGRERHLLLLVFHHIAVDGAALLTLQRDLWEFYRAGLEQRPARLPGLEVGYREFVDWQQAWLSGDALSSRLAFWRDQLQGADPGLPLPTDRPRPASRSDSGGIVRCQLSPATLAAVRKLADERQVTPFVVLTAALQLLFYRYSGQTDISIGTPVSNRGRLPRRWRKVIQNIVGPFLNTIVLRQRLDPQVTFSEHLSQVRSSVLAALAQQDLPFEKLVEEVGGERSLGSNPLFQFLFSLESAPPTLSGLGGLSVAPVAVHTGTAKFDLTITIKEATDGAGLEAEYSRDLFDGETIERLLRHFVNLLDQVGSDPDRSLSALPMLNESERRELLIDWNDTTREYPRDETLHGLLEAQARRTPDAIAVVCEGRSLTYRELARRATLLAQHLRSLGVASEVLVGLFVPRSLEMVIGLLGILKAGGVYVPLDPDYPAARLSYMLADTDASVVLTQGEVADRLPASRATRVNLDTFDWSQALPDTPLDPAVGPENLAYVMYTSGSTGQPKGVEVCHRGVVRLCTTADYVSLGPESSVLQLGSIAFDASTFEIWGPLLNGGRCVVFPDRLYSIEQLRSTLDRECITTLWLTASLFNTVLDEAPNVLEGLSELLTGGEALSVSHVRRALAALPDTRIINGYGPTEGTTFSCCFELPDALDETALNVPIGRPLANTRCYVLSPHLEPQPIGVPGELYLGGDGLARGYLNRPELSAERFVPDPFGAGIAEPLYRTGDRVRWRPDGNLEFLGRLDDQIKLRGFRIEPGEVAAVLTEHAEVATAAVLTREGTTPDHPHERALVAYVVPKKQCRPSETELRAFLESRLPQFMIPTAYVLLAALPRSANGKLDRAGLPAPDPSSVRSPSTGDMDSAAPVTPRQQAVIAIWREVLGLEQIGIHDSFFALGGHSLLATRIISRINQRYGLNLPLRHMFDFPTVAALSARIDTED